jgi:hypothetical protein
MDNYKVKVMNDDTYLWGGEGVKLDLSVPLLLTIRVEDFREPITFGIESTASDSRKTLGVLKAGETYTVLLKGLRGVFARCERTNVDANVTCYLSCPLT